MLLLYAGLLVLVSSSRLPLSEISSTHSSRLGLSACLIPSKSLADDIRNIFHSSSPKAVVAHPETLDTVKKVWNKENGNAIPILLLGTEHAVNDTELLAQYTRGDKHGELPRVNPDTPAFIVCTSGSTGHPKPVVLT